MDELFDKIQEAFEDYEDEELVELIREALSQGAEPAALIRFLSEILEKIGKQFSEGTLFLPDMVMAGDQMEQCMEVIRPELEKGKEGLQKIGKVVLGSVAGDIHDIGKNMVKAMLNVTGFEVVDLGTDVSPAQFYNAVVSEKPQIVGLSSCMVTTIPNMQDTIDLLHAKGLTDQVKIVVGGGSMNPALAAQMGHCTYGGHDAFEAAQILKTLVS